MAQTFRGDIQGLRAVAVLTVVAAHAGVPFLPGGFVGVDVFFVVSGYLISGLLLGEVAARGRVSLLDFWSRRARRILPAASVVTVATVLASLAALSLVDARQVLVDGWWAALFAANVHFAQQDVLYFAQDSTTSPLQHYWSLAVEEQFYVVWPLLLIGCLAATRRLRRRRAGGDRSPDLPRRPVFAMLLVLTGASFVWSVVHTAGDPQAAYFSPFTRAWELGVGALLAVVPARRLRMGRRVRTGLAAAGLLGILVACATYDDSTAVPGTAALLPVLATALVLVSGSGGRPPAGAVLLTNPVLRAVGDWSYSLYLWHWPALLLSQAAAGRPLVPLETALVVAAAVGLAALTHRFVETPFRTGRVAPVRRPRWALALYPASLALVAATCLGAWHWTEHRGAERGDNPPIALDGSARNAIELVRASVAAARNDVAIPSDLTPDLLRLRESVADVGACDYHEDVRELCVRGDEHGRRTVVVIGDSHARAWIPAFDRIGVSAGWRAFYLVKPQCTAAHVTVAPLQVERPFTECDAFQDWVVDQVERLRPDLVVVASSPPVNGVYDGDVRHEALAEVSALLGQGYEDLFAELRLWSERVVLLRDVPKSADDPGACLTRADPSLEKCMFEPVPQAQVLADVAVSSAEAVGAEVVDPTPWLCYEGVCPVVVGGTLTYRDSDHLTTEYAASLAAPLGRALDMLGAG